MIVGLLRAFEVPVYVADLQDGMWWTVFPKLI